jgi:hypothetical protein
MRTRIAIGVGLLVSHASADVIRVPLDRPTIQSAIDAARSGDEIEVSPGRYAELINFAGKSVTVRSVAGPGATTIDAGARASSAVTFATREGSASVLRGFTITGVRVPNGEQTVASGVRIVGASPMVIDCVIEGNAGFPAGGVSVRGGSPVLEDVTVRENTGVDAGGLASERATVTINGSTFEGNAGFRSGGVHALGGRLVVRESEFSSNGSPTGGSGGGAMTLVGTTFDIRGSGFTSNGSAEELPGGGTVYYTFAGGGIYAIQNSSGTIDASRFVGNTATRGGGVYFRGTSAREIVVTNSVFNANIAGAFSGATYVAVPSTRFVNCTFVGNNGVAFTDFASSVTIANSILFNSGATGLADSQVLGNGTAVVTYSIATPQADGDVTFGPGNISDRLPMFVDADGADGIAGTTDDDLRLADGSAGIDAGSNELLPVDVTLDGAGLTRFVDDPVVDDTGVGVGAIVDFGAFEVQASRVCPADFNRDGFVDWHDVELYVRRFEEGGASSDLNGDGFLDFFDYESFIGLFEIGC